MKTSSLIKKKNYRLCENLIKTHNSDTITLIENCHEIASRKLSFFNHTFRSIFLCVNIKQKNKKKMFKLKTITLGSN